MLPELRLQATTSMGVTAGQMGVTARRGEKVRTAQKCFGNIYRTKKDLRAKTAAGIGGRASLKMSFKSPTPFILCLPHGNGRTSLFLRDTMTKSGFFPT